MAAAERSTQRGAGLLVVLVACGFLATCGYLMHLGSAPPQPYRQSDGRWSDDPSVRAEKLFKESDERHRRTPLAVNASDVVVFASASSVESLRRTVPSDALRHVGIIQVGERRQQATERNARGR